MICLKHILNFYINSSIHVAIAVFSLSYMTLLEFNISYDKAVLYFIFYATITGYNFVKYFEVAKFQHRSLSKWLRLIQIFSLICFVFMGYYSFNLEKITIIYIAVFAILTFLYTIPFIPKRKFLNKQSNLRNISGLKVFLIALVWVGVTVFIPLQNNHFSMDTMVVIVSVQRFLLVIMLMLPFEIRDLQFDSLKLYTIPQNLGVKRTKILGFFLGLGMLILEFLKQEVCINRVLVLLTILVLTVLLIWFSREKQGRYYAAFWVEGIPILWLLLMLVVN
ncbi:hypothetical protein V8G56_14760 [Gaetbulibacter aquiaggeris]|uniref:Prenyltransferase n=1 Tax=Gaetbulibacter aquiaggeris TaxID=1735373 RepID=A0ABW7MT49_9FLAO